MVRDWDELKKAEARELFDRYVAGHGIRLDRFARTYAGMKGKPADLDYSAGSLVTVWKWFNKRCRLPRSPMSLAEYNGLDPDELPMWHEFQPPLFREAGPQVAEISSGLGAYVAETVLRRVDGSFWWLEPDRSMAGHNQPTIRAGSAVWFPDGTITLCLQALRKQPLGHGRRGDDPERLVEILDRLAAAAEAGAPEAGDVDESAVPTMSITEDGPRLLLTFDDQTAHRRSARIDQLVASVVGLPAVASAHREDRELVLVESVAGLPSPVASIENAWRSIAG